MINCLFIWTKTELRRAQTIAIILLFITSVCYGCAREEEPQCWPEENQYYVEALSKRLSKNGVTHSFHPKGSVPNRSEASVCYAPRFKPDVKKATQEVDNYFREVAGVLRDACEERAFVEWAAKEKLPIEVVDTESSDGKYAGRMFLIYSITPEDVALNRQKLLDGAPRNARCEKK
jgi:hypothetical protein